MTGGGAGAARDETPVVALRGVRLAYDRGFALDVPALDVRPGEVLALIGPNGSGKSTLLRVLGLLQAPDEGEVRLHGERVTAGGGLAARRRMATVFQQPLLAAGTVADNVALGLRFRGVPARERAVPVAAWLERLGLAALGDRPAHAISGGQAQRVALARALVLRPDVLLLDEPFAALDEPTRADLLPDLATILRAERVTTVLVTHDRGEARALADRVGVLLDGRLEQLGDTAQVFQAPASEAIARLVGVETIVGGEVIEAAGGLARVEVGGRVLEVATGARRGEPVRICLRPEDVILARDGTAARRSSARNHLAGTVRHLAPAASHVRVVLDCGFSLVAAVTPRSVEELGLAEGAQVTAVFKASAAHVIRLGGRAAGGSLDTRERPAL